MSAVLQGGAAGRQVLSGGPHFTWLATEQSSELLGVLIDGQTCPDVQPVGNTIRERCPIYTN